MLLFGLHCHQPVDNFGWVVDKAVEDCYSPLINKLYNYPNFKFSMHFSGWLLEYIRKNFTHIFDMLKKMAKRGQIEFFSGGFYEPILEAIPSDDRKSQIKRMNNYIRKHFAQTPKGLWLTERVYSDEIVKDIVESGMEYTTIDDIFTKEFSYTEVGGHTLKLLPINKILRYSIPFKDADSVELLINSRDVNILFDDCEKFGVWPGTKEWVYDKKWIDKFLSKDIKTVLPREFVKNNTPIKVSLPNHSYQEMEEWSLDVNDYEKYKEIKGKLKDEESDLIERFVRGGVWKNFLNRYFEANWIQKRVWYLSKNKISHRRYLDYLFKSQCNDVLWHGVFGGLYLPNLRDNAYKYIIQCENMLENKGLEKYDIDMDFNEEFKYKGENYIAIFNSQGEMVEFDDTNNLFNFQNTLRRYKERYHTQSKEKNDFDTIHNKSFDFSQYPVKFDNYFNFSFITERDNFDVLHRKNKVTFTGTKLKKTYIFRKDKVAFIIDGTNNLRFNFHFAENHTVNIEDNMLKIYDDYTKSTIIVSFNKKFTLEQEDIITYSLKESGLDKIKQGVLFMFQFDDDSAIEGYLCLK